MREPPEEPLLPTRPFRSCFFMRHITLYVRLCKIHLNPFRYTVLLHTLYCILFICKIAFTEACEKRLWEPGSSSVAPMSSGTAVSGTTRVRPLEALSTCQNWSVAQGSEIMSCTSET